MVSYTIKTMPQVHILQVLTYIPKRTPTDNSNKSVTPHYKKMITIIMLVIMVCYKVNYNDNRNNNYVSVQVLIQHYVCNCNATCCTHCRKNPMKANASVHSVLVYSFDHRQIKMWLVQ